MKFKKAFAWILAVAMVITLMPSMAFATSTNTVRGFATVGTNTTLSAIEMNVEVRDNDWNIANTNRMKPQHIRLNLTNLTVDGTINGSVTGGATAATGSAIVLSSGHNLTIGYTSYDGTNSAGIASFDRDSVIVRDDSIEFTFNCTGSVKKSDVFKFTFDPGALKSGSESGPAEIAIDSIDADLTATGGLTVATVGSGGTVASVSGSTKTYGRISDVKMDTTIELRESVVGAITGAQVIKFTLPKGMSWESLDVGGTLFSNTGSIKFSSSSLTVSQVRSGAVGSWCFGSDDRTVYVKFGNNSSNDNTRRVATFVPHITIDKTASEGDITVDIASDWSNGDAISDASDLVVGQYGSESVKISTVADDKLPTIYSGYVVTNKEKNTWLQLTIEETVGDSLAEGRYIDIEFPEAIQVLKDVGIKATLDKNPVLDDANGSKYSKINPNLITYGDKDWNKDQSSFTVEVPADQAGSPNKNFVGKSSDTWKADKANKLTLFIPVTIRADFTGDIEATVKGGRAGVDDTTIVLGKAESPIKVETKTTEVRNGVQSQTLADITITENVAGYLDAATNSNKVILNIDTLKLDGTSITDAKVEVTDGDLEIKNVKKVNKGLTFDIAEESTKPSTISITGVVGALNRTLPEGPYALQVYGSALIQNGAYNDGDFDMPTDGDVCAATVADYIKIVTPADPSTITNKINAVFTLRQDTFTNNGETVQMDTAPYLDANNRTQLPIRYAAIACGVPESDISWNQATQTATINGQNVVLRITIGSNIMQTSAGNVTMDTAAVSSNGRIFVPIRYIANALGADVAWDQDAKTITLTN